MARDRREQVDVCDLGVALCTDDTDGLVWLHWLRCHAFGPPPLQPANLLLCCDCLCCTRLRCSRRRRDLHRCHPLVHDHHLRHCLCRHPLHSFLQSRTFCPKSLSARNTGLEIKHVLDARSCKAPPQRSLTFFICMWRRQEAARWSALRRATPSLRIGGPTWGIHGL